MYDRKSRAPYFLSDVFLSDGEPTIKVLFSHDRFHPRHRILRRKSQFLHRHLIRRGSAISIEPYHISLIADIPAPAERNARFDRQAYAAWLKELRAVCSQNGIVLIVDDVFVSFRIAPGGTQEYFGVRADMVTYGKTLGGGLPVGVLCGRKELMKRYRDDRPLDVSFARGTFNAHPYVMAAMNEFLRHLDTAEARTMYAGLDALWNARADTLNLMFLEDPQELGL